MLHYSFDVPDGVASLEIELSNVTGDPDLYVKHGSTPSINVNDCKSELSGGKDEKCTILNPESGTWHVMLYAFHPFSGVKLKGSTN